MHTKKPNTARKNTKPGRKPQTGGTPRNERPETTAARNALRDRRFLGFAPNYIAIRWLALHDAIAEHLAKEYGPRAEARLESAIARLWGKV